MGDSAKKALSERDICTKYITPALVAGHKWNQSQIRKEVSFTKGRVLAEYQAAQAAVADVREKLRREVEAALIR